MISHDLDAVSWKRDGVVRGYDSSGDLTYTSDYEEDGEVVSGLYGSSSILYHLRRAWKAAGTARVAIEFDLPLDDADD